MKGTAFVVDLHPEAARIRDAALSVQPLYRLPVHEARERMRAAFIRETPPEVAHVSNVTITAGSRAVDARLYHPSPTERRPLLVFLHGGGWIVNDLDVFDELCALISTSADCAVLSVDYRRSPEHKYPAALDDAKTALDWAAVNADAIGVDSARIAVGGDSAGGALAAGLAKLARDSNGPSLRALLLLYPITDYLDPSRPSYAERGPGFSVNLEFMTWIWDAYLPDDWSSDDPYLFPLRGDLAGLPHTILCVAEYDVLRDEGIAFAQGLERAGVTVDFMNAEDQMHGFAMYTETIDHAAGLVHEACQKLKAALRA